jgi:hypothetical protein
MDKKLARRNIRLGIVLFVVLVLMLGSAVAGAEIYINAVK